MKSPSSWFGISRGRDFGTPVGEFAEQGTDPLEIVTEYCRKEGVEIFATLRMNDVHDSSDRFSVLGSKFKRKNSRTLFGSSRKPPPYGYWSGADFSWKVIRNMTFKVLEEMASNYDLDGLELDFWRHPPYFKTYAWGEPVTQTETDSITRLMRRVRSMADARARERGRPLLIAVRVMDSPELNHDMGLDLVTWLREDLVDLVIIGEVALAPWEETIRLAHRYRRSRLSVHPQVHDGRGTRITGVLPGAGPDGLETGGRRDLPLQSLSRRGPRPEVPRTRRP